MAHPLATPFDSPLASLGQEDVFARRHIGPNATEIARMCAALGVNDLDDLIGQTVPAGIRLKGAPDLPAALTEHQALERLREIASRNQSKKSLIGLGYYGTLTPPVIQRNVFENPGWYTAYTPYQAELAQGRLEALLNFQQMVSDLTGLDLANASLLDEATAAAEAMAMARRLSKSNANAFFVDENCFPQTLDVLRTRAQGFGFELIVGPASQAVRHTVFGALFQYPGADGGIPDLAPILAALRENGAISAVASDLMALMLLQPPGALGADIALGSAQRFGVPMGYGGPHAAFFATRQAYVRAMPGRIIGVSRDSRGKQALRMTLQTREQHIRREKANSNICTSQVLLANMAGFYAIYHGPAGLKAIAARIHRLAGLLARGLQQAGYTLASTRFFDTLVVRSGKRSDALLAACEQAGYNLRRVSDEALAIAVDETVTLTDIAALLKIFGAADDLAAVDAQRDENAFLPAALLRTDAPLSHPVFNSHHAEHQMLRYLKRLQNRDLALDHSMIPLGSCTMKLNAASEMMPVSWPAFASLHPFAPTEQAAGYRELIDGLAAALRALTGFDAISMQPNSGAQGEYAGLVAIRRYQASRGEGRRDVCLIPRSAHGTNPATAQMCGMQVVVVDCDSQGNVELADLRAKLTEHAERLSALMITYPSTHGVFEESIREICELVHGHGGQVYMDGANLNAQVGLSAPAAIGADVSHMNLHKTFCIPHGGGGPGMGPIGVKTHLAPFLPDHVLAATGEATRANRGQGAVSAAPFGSASILPISWMYIAMMGADGLRQASAVAILNANYIAHRLAPHYPVLYTGRHGRVAHECILDIRPLKAASGISEVDIAKRLMDYGFHAPTMSFPVPGTIMVEPTESESLEELDRFIQAMISIRKEIREIENGNWPAEDNPLRNAPHTQADLADDGWHHPYSRRVAAFPLPWIADNKFWPSVNRIDDVYGDRNLQCSCPPPAAYED
ncbi:aminomethyl-transferring glycine dehydrogenase [Azoarcus indigens]|uniref:Glycine dehydrogenase (decarboxylating) n=1 Tax=Azoarcus indigens TaxID=29545 RepID=A0A4R6EEH4_9RHOO|nr:aminomethyl-transferring glycine dehydrogenase [Azoarcus indigens]NMG66237.1 aminomethyl-transferring glycine dehydrogenase [Azoarcus indigens]TDN56646.1 glycine dehydrogenase (decarboxylating) alpha subunit /glycine dehydrogenase (decarboxylating) beta subunit [Azoarcus indigens]